MADQPRRPEEEEDKSNANAIGFLQRRYTKPVESHHTYLNPEIQPTTTNEPRGENPWTGETAEEVREKAYSETMYQRMIHDDPHALVSRDDSNTNPNDRPSEEVDHKLELDEMMFDTAM
jgi:hypothetical protein